MVLFREPREGIGRTISTASGFGAAPAVRDSKLMIDGVRNSVPVTAFAGRAARPEAGLLPASLFRSVYVCNSGGYIIPGAGW